MKKSKNEKTWERKKTSSGYQIGKFSQNKSILIVCEGQTEEKYFKSFDVVSLKIECVNTKGLSKIQLIDFCQKKVEEYKDKLQ